MINRIGPGLLVESHRDQFWVLFAIYINDLDYSITSDINKFVVDTKIERLVNLDIDAELISCMRGPINE